jgi:hypothetical protein
VVEVGANTIVPFAPFVRLRKCLSSEYSLLCSASGEAVGELEEVVGAMAGAEEVDVLVEVGGVSSSSMV